jgi:hypothetical protein
MKRRFKNPNGIPDYTVGPSFDVAGANAFVFQREFFDPVLLFRGPGRVPRGTLRVFQQPQVFINARTTERGIGGIVAGQMILQPLSNNGGG